MEWDTPGVQDSVSACENAKIGVGKSGLGCLSGLSRTHVQLECY